MLASVVQLSLGFEQWMGMELIQNMAAEEQMLETVGRKATDPTRKTAVESEEKVALTVVSKLLFLSRRWGKRIR